MKNTKITIFIIYMSKSNFPILAQEGCLNPIKYIFFLFSTAFVLPIFLKTSEYRKRNKNITISLEIFNLKLTVRANKL